MFPSSVAMGLDYPRSRRRSSQKSNDALNALELSRTNSMTDEAASPLADSSGIASPEPSQLHRPRTSSSTKSRDNVESRSFLHRLRSSNSTAPTPAVPNSPQQSVRASFAYEDDDGELGPTVSQIQSPPIQQPIRRNSSFGAKIKEKLHGHLRVHPKKERVTPVLEKETTNKLNKFWNLIGSRDQGVTSPEPGSDPQASGEETSSSPYPGSFQNLLPSIAEDCAKSVSSKTLSDPDETAEADPSGGQTAQVAGSSEAFRNLVLRTAGTHLDLTNTNTVAECAPSLSYSVESFQSEEERPPFRREASRSCEDLISSFAEDARQAYHSSSPPQIPADFNLTPRNHHGPANMDLSRLVPGSFDGPNRDRQIQDAKDMYQTVIRNAERANTAVPPYDFIELIGKGGYGRVYKCKDRNTGDLVAVKIINIDDADFQEHYLDKDNAINAFRKEVGILQQLKDSRAKNINMIHDAFDLHNQLWIVSDYCTGGSLRTLMRANPPTRRGFEEQFIVPIARELALAIKSVHDIGVIHRDIKCANVYVNEEGDIQLGDFGIVGVVENDDGSSKRRTIVGTPHYLPREMHVAASHLTDEAYGTEVDIWSYGITIFEMATGLPPYSNVPQSQFHTVIDNAPRLEGGDYSDELRDFVAFCLNSDPKERPSAEAVLKHPYIANTSKRYPTKSLVQLIERYAAWEYKGGQRQSLWAGGGAAAPVVPSDDDETNDQDDVQDWNFSTSESFNVAFGKRYSQMVATQDFADAHFEAPAGSGLPPLITKDLTPLERFEQAHRDMSANRGERSLDRLFNPVTSPYELHTPIEPDPISDLPLRSMGAGMAPTRESLIDLDSAGGLDLDVPTFNFEFGDVPTLKAKTASRILGKEDVEDEEFTYGANDKDERRATMEWKFPSTEKKRATMDWTFQHAEPALQDEEAAVPSMKLPPKGAEGLPPGFRPTLKHTTTEPIGQFKDFMHPAPSLIPTSEETIRDSMASMIDLDRGLADPAEIPRPSTATSATGSTNTDMTSGNPFDLEEDPEQNELDRNRFSYHKQWQSEGGQMKRSSHKTMPMHSRGSSLTSTDSELDHLSHGSESGGDDVFDYEYRSEMADTMRTQMGLGIPQIDMSHWPNFGTDSGLDEEPTYPAHYVPRLGEADFPLQQGLRTNGHGMAPQSFSRPRDVSNARGSSQREIEFPEALAPHPNALKEDADPQLVAADLDRLLDELDRGLKATSRALQQCSGMNNEESVLSETDSGMESSALPTDGEGGF